MSAMALDAPERPNDPRINVAQQELFDERKSKAQKYAELVVGRSGFFRCWATSWCCWRRLGYPARWGSS